LRISSKLFSNRKNSSSVAIIGVKPSALARAICAFSIWRGACGTGSWVWWSIRSQSTIAVPSSQGRGPQRGRSGFMT
jgi:hypothetical protein